MSLHSFIKTLQSKPYAIRMRILWLASAVVALVLLMVWGGLVRHRNADSSREDTGIVGYFGKLFESARFQISRFQDTGGAAAPQAEVSLKNFTKDNISQTLTISFTIKNSSNDILKFLDSGLNNVTLSDGDRKLQASSITTELNNPFPKNILSNTEASGHMVFPLPQEKVIAVNITGLAFMQTPEKTFGKILPLDLSLRDLLRSPETGNLPRE